MLPYQHPRLIPLGRMLYNLTTSTRARDNVHIVDENIGTTILRRFTPEGPLSGGAVLWLHGGGYVGGKVEQLNEVASVFAKKLQAVIVTVRYRWAPEHPYPAALDDVYEAWRWMTEKGSSAGINPAQVAVLGQSAGGGLAAALVLRIRDAGGQQPAAQVLHYPMLDDRTAADQALDRRRYKLWNNRCNRTAWDAYLTPARAGDAELPPYAAAARRNDLGGLPPTWLGVGSADLFYAEAKAYAERLKRSGVACEEMYLEGAPHVFEIIAPTWSQSQAFLHATFLFLKHRLAISAPDIRSFHAP